MRDDRRRMKRPYLETARASGPSARLNWDGQVAFQPATYVAPSARQAPADAMAPGQRGVSLSRYNVRLAQRFFPARPYDNFVYTLPSPIVPVGEPASITFEVPPPRMRERGRVFDG